MTDDEVREALEAAVAAAGGALQEAVAVTREVTGRGVLTRWDCVTSVGGTFHAQTLFAEVGRGGAARSGALRLSDGTADIDVWAWPHDPELPTLPLVTVPDAAAVLVARLGLPVTPTRLDVMAHRPLKRAVVRVGTTGGDLFVKVVRPVHAELLANRHGRWRAAGVPVPEALGWSPSGLVALQALGGIDAAERVGTVQAACLLDGVDALRERIAALRETERARDSLVQRAGWYAAGLRALAGDAAELRVRTDGFATGIGAALAGAPAPERRVVHGDLHLAQVRVAPQGDPTVVGLLDIDTAGVGDPADDDAALIVHALVTAEVRATHGDSAASTAWRDLALLAVRRGVTADPGRARRAAVIGAVHVAGHALRGTLSLPVALDRIDALLDERPLTEVSCTPHAATGE